MVIVFFTRTIAFQHILFRLALKTSTAFWPRCSTLYGFSGGSAVATCTSACHLTDWLQPQTPALVQGLRFKSYGMPTLPPVATRFHPIEQGTCRYPYLHMLLWISNPDQVGDLCCTLSSGFWYMLLNLDRIADSIWASVEPVFILKCITWICIAVHI